jgi:carnitine 3-dehydrogenase
VTGLPSGPVTDDRLPRRAALLGSGVIGGGWAARLLLFGVDVALYDPAPGAAETARAALERARRSWSRLTLVKPPAPGTLRLANSVEEAVTGAELVQESAPEREPLKLELLAQACQAAPADAIIASSTSGLLPSRISSGMADPERFLVAHPFNPVYLLPLVELCGGSRTSPETIERAASLYRALGMHPLVVRHEIDGFIADRLLEAVWREALWLVHDGIATAEEIDDALRYGPGLRWSTMGTFLIYRLAGGEAGMRHFMAQFGPTLKLPWTKLTDVPELDDKLLDTLVAQSDAQAAGRSIEQLARIRDDSLVAVLSGLRGQSWGAGVDVAATERRWQRAMPAATGGLAASGDGPAATGDRPAATGGRPAATGGRPAATGGRPAATGDGRLHLYELIVAPDWIDYNGHMTEHRYLEVLADTTDVFLPLIGAGGDYAASGRSFYTVETHIRHLGEAHAGDRLTVSTQLLHHDPKRLRLFHEIRRADDGSPVATGEHMLLHVDMAAGRAAPAGAEVLGRLDRIAAAQRALPWPESAGRAIDPGLRGTSTDGVPNL